MSDSGELVNYGRLYVTVIISGVKKMSIIIA